MKYIDADKLRAEIERRIKSCDATSKTPDQLLWAELGALISFLDTLEEPDKDLEEAAEEFANQDCVTFISRKKGFIAGAEWQKEQDEMSKVNYEGARAVYDNTVQHLQEKIDEKYELGKKDMKEQMMKESVEGVVCYGSKGAYIETDFLGEYDTDVYGNPGDKVRIIILPKED